jgi:hypothetical protein
MRRITGFVLAVGLLPLASGCLASGSQPSLPSGPSNGSHVQSKFQEIDGIATVPGLLVALQPQQKNAVVYEYSRTAVGAATPIRRITSTGMFVIGYDKLGRIYSLNAPASCPCSVFVQNSDGSAVRTIPLTTKETAVPPFTFSVDPVGNIYFLSADSPGIVELPADVHAKPRKISLPKRALQSSIPYAGMKVYARENGQVYLWAPYGQYGYAIYVFAPKAQGNAKPSRTIISKKTQYGVYGVDTSGNAWVLPPVHAGSTTLNYFPSTAHGSSSPNVVRLKGGLDVVGSLSIASNDQLVYEGATADNQPQVYVAPPLGGKPVRRALDLPKAFKGDELLGVTY